MTDRFVARIERLRRRLALEGTTDGTRRGFRRLLYDHYRERGRTFSWRTGVTPYRVVVSEVMLQQTQTTRVEERFEAFVATFPDFEALATAPLSAVLRAWQGMGYNRRAKSLHRLAAEVLERFDGLVPDSPDLLRTLPGIGPATAASIAAFAFDRPTIFLETNVRTVFIHLWFGDEDDIGDDLLLPLVEATLDRRHPGRWYNAVMDLGALIKATWGNASRRSKHYVRQSAFEGSRRQVRGRILKLLVDRSERSRTEVAADLSLPLARVTEVVDHLLQEGFLVETKRGLRIR